MRRLAAAVVAAALTIIVAGCGSGNDNDQTAATPAKTPAVTETAAPTATEAADKDKGEDEDEDEDKDKGEEERGAAKDCDEVGDLHAKPKHKLPVPLAAGARVYESQGPFGKTTRYFAVAKGDAESLPEWRDRVDAKLKAAGYKVLDTDQEEGAEAEGHLSGPHTVDVQVISLCKGKVRIRYTVS
jgi:hypothetical protein